VREVDEAWTSKTCSRCGKENMKLGGNEVFTCIDHTCNFKCDRDVNGGKNIALKNACEIDSAAAERAETAREAAAAAAQPAGGARPPLAALHPSP